MCDIYADSGSLWLWMVVSPESAASESGAGSLGCENRGCERSEWEGKGRDVREDQVMFV